MFYKRQIIAFIKKVVRDERLCVFPANIKLVTTLAASVPCEVKLFDLSKENNMVICFINLNKRYFTLELNKNILKAYLLHELGHCFSPKKMGSSAELCAQVWAIEKSKKMNMPVITKILENLVEEWVTMGWKHKKLRIYIRAGRAYNKIKNSKSEIKNLLKSCGKL